MKNYEDNESFVDRVFYKIQSYMNKRVFDEPYKMHVLYQNALNKLILLYVFEEMDVPADEDGLIAHIIDIFIVAILTSIVFCLPVFESERNTYLDNTTKYQETYKNYTNNEAEADEVIESVKEGKFHVYAISTLDEGIEILTGVPAGKKNKYGTYPASIKSAASKKKTSIFPAFLSLAISFKIYSSTAG